MSNTRSTMTMKVAFGMALLVVGTTALSTGGQATKVEYVKPESNESPPGQLLAPKLELKVAELQTRLEAKDAELQAKDAELQAKDAALQACEGEKSEQQKAGPIPTRHLSFGSTPEEDACSKIDNCISIPQKQTIPQQKPTLDGIDFAVEVETVDSSGQDIDVFGQSLESQHRAHFVSAISRLQLKRSWVSYTKTCQYGAGCQSQWMNDGDGCDCTSSYAFTGQSPGNHCPDTDCGPITVDAGYCFSGEELAGYVQGVVPLFPLAQVEAFLNKAGITREDLKGETLRFNNKGLNNEDMNALAYLIHTGSLGNLMLLDLYGNSIGDEGLTAFASAIASGSLPNLQELNLGSNKIGDAGMTELSRAIASGSMATLEVLGLLDNQISDAGMSAFAGAIASGSMGKLTHLYLQANQIGDAGMIEFSQAIANGSLASLTRLNLRGNNLTQTGKTAITTAASKRSINCDV